MNWGSKMGEKIVYKWNNEGKTKGKRPDLNERRSKFTFFLISLSFENYLTARHNTNKKQVTIP
jgi:hypothetical protein